MPIKMHCLIRAVRFSSTLISTRFPRPILKMSPRFQYLTSSSHPTTPAQEPASLLAEVLRSHSYLNQAVLLNTLKMLAMSNATGARADGVRLAKMKFFAVVFHAISDDSSRETLKNSAEKLEKCKVPMFKKEQDLFYNSMQTNATESYDLSFTKCMHKSDLVLCYFRREIEMKNWEKIKNLLTSHPTLVPLYEHIDAFLEVAKSQKIAPDEVLDIVLEYSRGHNPYFLEREDFEKVLRKVFKSCSARVSTDGFDKIEKTYISEKEAIRLKKRIDEYVKASKEGFVKTKEYTQVAKKVADLKKEKNIEDGQSVVVVDALNFGRGRDPKEWKSISEKFDHVQFASRTPPKNVYDEVMERYKGDALFCDKLSADDLLILRMALEFGPSTSLVTNDRYRDHRSVICNGDSELERIWDDFLIDAVYRHFDGRIESRRDFNLRFRKVDGKWLVPVLDSEGLSEKFRRLKIYSVE